MKILFTKEKTVIVEMEYEKANDLFKDIRYKDEFEKACKSGVDVELSFQANNFNDTDYSKLKRTIESMDSTLSFLKNQMESIYGKVR